MLNSCKKLVESNYISFGIYIFFFFCEIIQLFKLFYRAANIKETSNRREALRKCEKYATKLGRLVEDMEKNSTKDENILLYGKRLLHVVCSNILIVFFLF